ncbi:hypothetical protein L1987_14228 [Smallanthus sonchifolius]|uniref:Uncharacterized protein n=1 Tax=Smallanthus sonchifolius TaxID=185202 RepID=A0ACB9J3S8_9ASTR|nr:hypothetical protein L1987_14228 [Smallanthus sonchifolius]
MDSNELLTNITALGVLVITLVVNVCIQIDTGVISYKEDAQLLKTFVQKYDLKSRGIHIHRNTIIATIYVTLLMVLLIVHWILPAVLSSSRQNNHNVEQSQYVLQLENEIQLAERTLEGLSKSVNRLIQKGVKKQPNNLMKLIQEKSTIGFQGVKKFDNGHYVPSLETEVEYQNCWSLPVVTQTTIAVCLPNIKKVEVDSLWESVREGLEYVRRVEETLNATNDYLSIQKAAKTLWQEIYVYHKWLGDKLQHIPSQVNACACEVDTTLQIVELFLKRAKSKINDGVGSMDIGSTDGDSKCVFICAISMSHISKTIIDDMESQNELFVELSSMISDIMAACLTNLPQVITMKCHTTAIEKREGCVLAAAQLLGETKEMISTLQGQDIPCLNRDDLPFIDK